MNGEIFFDMTREQCPVSGSSKFLMKRWKKYTIYAKSGSYNRTDNPLQDLYVSNSIYLYDYVIVSDKWFYEMVYTASIDDTTPSYGETDVVGTEFWKHRENTFKNSPNAITNNYVYTYDESTSTTRIPPRPIYNFPVIYTDDGTYFEIVKGYPRNHYTHKRHLFSIHRFKSYGLQNNVVVNGIYYKNRQTINTTIGEDGLENGTSPVQSVQVGNLNLIQSDNVINH